MKIASAALPLAALLLSHPAVAASDYTLSGTYAFMAFTQCTGGFSTTSTQVLTPPTNNPGTTTVLGSVNTPIQTGVLAVDVGYITFTPSSQTSGTAAGSSNGIGGGTLEVDGNGYAMQPESNSFSGAYSFNVSAGTFTLGGETYKLAVGGISSLGLVQTAYLVGQQTDNGNSNCLNAITVTRRLAVGSSPPQP